MDEIRQVNLQQTPMDAFQKHLADIVVLTEKNSLLLQYRPKSWRTGADKVCLFGGHVEQGERPVEAAARELNEETGGIASLGDLITIGTITENWTNYTQAVHIYFWHDIKGSITGCYEAESITFNTAAAAMNHQKIMPYAKWALKECVLKGLLSS